MDLVSIGAVLAAVAGGAGGELGAQVWAGVSALVRRPFRRARKPGDTAGAIPSGEAELTALLQAPADTQRALALAEVLVARAGDDAGFREALAAWWVGAGQLIIGGDVANTISGGSFHGPVLQGRDFTGLSFGSSAATPPARSAQDESTP